jgi:hypothetical protein
MEAHVNSKYKMLTGIMLILGLAGLFSGCTGALLKNTGSLKPSTTATIHFEKFVINNDYNYFLTGSDVYPVAIFGLKKSYVIDSHGDLWKKIESKQEIISGLVSNMQMRLLDCCLQRAHGFDILDNHGQKIGEWYSMMGLISGITIKENGKVVIYPPLDTDDVKKYQQRTSGRGL